MYAHVHVFNENQPLEPKLTVHGWLNKAELHVHTDVKALCRQEQA